MKLLSLKGAAARTLCHPIVGHIVARMARDRICTGGCGVDTSDAVVSPRVKAALFWGFYESAEIRFVRQYLRVDCDAVELGSSLGVVSCNVRRRLMVDRRLVCVEANPELIPVLESTLRLNACDRNVSVVGGAIDYTTPLNKPIVFAAGESNLQGRIATSAQARRRITVSTLTLSDVLDLGRIGGAYSLVCDIEGAEAQIIAHERAALKRCTQLVIELHPTTVDGAVLGPDELLGLIIRIHGFRLRDRYGSVCVFDR